MPLIRASAVAVVTTLAATATAQAPIYIPAPPVPPTLVITSPVPQYGLPPPRRRSVRHAAKVFAGWSPIWVLGRAFHTVAIDAAYGITFGEGPRHIDLFIGLGYNHGAASSGVGFREGKLRVAVQHRVGVIAYGAALGFGYLSLRSYVSVVDMPTFQLEGTLTAEPFSFGEHGVFLEARALLDTLWGRRGFGPACPGFAVGAGYRF